jgi:hypothetical protein
MKPCRDRSEERAGQVQTSRVGLSTERSKRRKVDRRKKESGRRLSGHRRDEAETMRAKRSQISQKHKTRHKKQGSQEVVGSLLTSLTLNGALFIGQEVRKGGQRESPFPINRGQTHQTMLARPALPTSELTTNSCPRSGGWAILSRGRRD